MYQCTLEKVVKSAPNRFKKTGQKMVSFVAGVTPEQKGKIIDLKKKDDFWLVEDVYEQSVDHSKINRSWNVGGL